MKFIISACIVFAAFSLKSQNLTTYRSARSVDETVNRIVEIIKKKKLAYFETVEHDKVAKEYGVEIPPTRMILFEDPNLMIELIACRQTTALDLPMRILVWEEHGDVYVGFFDPKMMKKRFMLQECDDVITSMSRLKIRVVNEALREGD
ncbi:MULTISPECIES: DUF302 domain-containing protein [unclassified Ekhidna]|jgi:uncharacterized protein (DUF302 family)|uniref:DUF302 domain-containing protein n=1 Tax=unclassified Ekhidna TaxID=2632188 RepID=UPI0032DF7BAE